MRDSDAIDLFQSFQTPRFVPAVARIAETGGSDDGFIVVLKAFENGISEILASHSNRITRRGTNGSRLVVDLGRSQPARRYTPAEKEPVERNISDPTAKVHRRNAYAKLKIRSQADLFGAFLRFLSRDNRKPQASTSGFRDPAKLGAGAGDHWL